MSMEQPAQTQPLIPENSLVSRLIGSAASDWLFYVRHPFVEQLARGTLPEAAFRHYLVQDYLFLIQFARAYGLAVYKADTLDDMRAAADAVRAILEVEMGLHVRFCAEWGLTEAQMAAVPEDDACLAYTRFVLERGMAGDILDLQVALAPCVVGYGVIAERLVRNPATVYDGNRYSAWIDMYAGEEYRELARAAVTRLDRLAMRRGAGSRFQDLASTFRIASRLEAGFWQMGLDAAKDG
jgi:thiaminase (transcriptional activator TenA)